MASPPDTAPLVLHPGQGGHVTVEPADEARFEQILEDVVHACRAWKHRAAFEAQFRDLLDHLAAWFAQQPDVSEAFVSTRGECVYFLPRHTGTNFNSDLSGRLAELELEIAHSGRFPLVQLSTLGLSINTSLETFIGRQKAIQYGRTNSA